MKNIFKIAEVSWTDSRMFMYEQSMDDEYNYALVSSVGYVLHNDKEKLVLMGDIIDSNCRRVLVIPKKDIVKLKILK